MKSKSVTLNVHLELIHIKDKVRRISAPQPDINMVQIVGSTDKKTIVLREFSFDTKAAAKAHYNHLKDILYSA